MCRWHKSIQSIVLQIDKCIKSQNDEALTLANLSEFLGYSEYYVSRKFKEISGMQLRDYLRYRKLAFALKDIQNTESGYELDITSGRVFYFYHDCKHFWKYIRPVKKQYDLQKYQGLEKYGFSRPF